MGKSRSVPELVDQVGQGREAPVDPGEVHYLGWSAAGVEADHRVVGCHLGVHVPDDVLELSQGLTFVVVFPAHDQASEL